MFSAFQLYIGWGWGGERDNCKKISKGMHRFMREPRNDRKRNEYCITVPRTFVHDCSYPIQPSHPTHRSLPGPLFLQVTSHPNHSRYPCFLVILVIPPTLPSCPKQQNHHCGVYYPRHLSQPIHPCHPSICSHRSYPSHHSHSIHPSHPSHPSPPSHPSCPSPLVIILRKPFLCIRILGDMW